MAFHETGSFSWSSLCCFIFLFVFTLFSLSRFPTMLASTSPSSTYGIKGGYWPTWVAHKLPPSSISTSYFTHLFYAFVKPNNTTYQLSIGSEDDRLMRSFTSTIRSMNPPVKTILSIGGGGESTNSLTFPAMANTSSTRAVFINSTIYVAREYGFDGLDLDWEFPQTPQNMSNLALLLKEWHQQIQIESYNSGKPRLILSAAVYFASSFFLADKREYPIEEMKKYLDFINLMCYDYRGSWNTTKTGEHALLFDKTSNISTSYGIKSWIDSGVPAEKLVMGLPLYGKTWKLKNPNENGIGAPAVGAGPGEDGIMVYRNIEDFNLENKTTVVYDAETVSTYSFVGTTWIGYDGPVSIMEKVKFAKENGLGGYFFWALGYEKNWTISQSAFRAWEDKY